MAIKTYKKGTAVQLSTNFKSTEFDCQGSGCCSSTLIDENLVKYLQEIRKHFGKAVNINSGYRCKTHNANVGGASQSNHMDGEAADIRISGITPLEVAQYAEHIGVLGIGVYSWGIHIDTRTTKYFWYDGGASNVKTFGGNFVKEETLEIDTSKVVDKAADPKVIWDYFKSKGLNDYGVAGLMGNLYAESAFKPCNLQNTYEKSLNMTDAEYTAAVDAGIYTNFIYDKAGYGLAQWTFWSLKRDLLEFAHKKNKSIGDLNLQMEFLANQLSTEFKLVWDTLKTASSLLEASNAVLLNFERPADQSEAVQNKRAEYGKKYLDAYGNKKTESKIEIPANNTGNQMKYSEKNKPLVCMQTQSKCYKGTSTMTVKGILWHSTGANNPNLKRYVQPSDDAKDKDEWIKLLGKNTYGNDWNHTSVQAGLNCWIGKLADGTVTTVQTMPWNYKPWGCGSGSKGSCNNGWIQFEICEDGLNNKDYFEKVYQEACEITAYLCKMYNIDPKGTITYNGIKVPTILCHADSYKLGLGSNHGDVLHWFPKFNKDMADVRNDVAKLMGSINSSQKEEIKNETPKNEVENTTSNSLKIGDIIQLKDNATYSSGKEIPDWVFSKKLYVREIRSNGDIVISTLAEGAITGIVKADVIKTNKTSVPPTQNVFTPYLVKINVTILNVRAGAGTNYKINTQVKKNGVYTIVEEKNGWGKLKSGAGWISLDYTKKI